MSGGPDGRQEDDSAAVIFFDGHCGLCHRWVKFVIPRDRRGRFRFSPLQGETLTRRLDAGTVAALPDSVVLLEPDGTLRMRTDAVLAIFCDLGPGWRMLARLGRWVPRPIRDVLYDGVAAVRHRVFAPPAETCPLMPPELRCRFLP